MKAEWTMSGDDGDRLPAGPARTRVKICGLVREQDVAAAVDAGADAVGLVFYPDSKRYVSPAQAARLRALVPAFVDVVALFVNATEAEIDAVRDLVGPDLLQFHGDETPACCRRCGQRYLRAFRVGGASMATAGAVLAKAQAYPDAAAWLFDSDSAGFGGSGHGFDHALLADVRAQGSAPPVVLAGGLTPENVATAIGRLRPYAVDVSSGVESAPGLKCPQRIRAFMQAVREADGLLQAE